MFHTIGNTIAGGLKKGFFKVSYVAIEFLLRYPTINPDLSLSYFPLKNPSNKLTNFSSDTCLLFEL